MLEGKTKSGFKFKVDSRALTDWRVVDAFGIMHKATEDIEILNATKTAMEIILGKDKEKLEQHIAKNNSGFIPTEVLIAEFTEIVTMSKELKNS